MEQTNKLLRIMTIQIVLITGLVTVGLFPFLVLVLGEGKTHIALYISLAVLITLVSIMSLSTESGSQLRRKYIKRVAILYGVLAAIATCMILIGVYSREIIELFIMLFYAVLAVLNSIL